MNQSILSVPSSSATGGLWTSGAGAAAKSSGAQGADSAFGLTLLSMMGGDSAATQEAVLAAQLGLLTLTDASEAADGSAEADLSGLLDGLIAQLEEADKQLAYSEELLAMLQGWLQNAVSMLHHAPHAQVEQNASNEALLTLAEQPHTIRFALQDVMLQLAHTSGANSQQLTSVTAAQATSMLESLQALLAQAGYSPEAAQTERNGQTAGSEFAGKLTSQLELANQDARQLQVSGTDSQRFTVNSLKPGADSRGGQIPVHMVQQQAESSHSVSGLQVAAESAMTETDGVIQPGTIITAGQLALRDLPGAALKLPAAQVPVERFSEEVGKFIIHKLDLIKAGGVSEARISLYPEHLGQVDIKITMQNGHMTAQFVTEHLFAKDSLESQMAQLRSALQSQGLQVSKLEVTQNDSLSSHMYQDGRQQGGSSNSNPQHSDRHRNEIREEDHLATQDLNEEWLDWMSEVRTREAGLGSSFVARV